MSRISHSGLHSAPQFLNSPCDIAHASGSVTSIICPCPLQILINLTSGFISSVAFAIAAAFSETSAAFATVTRYKVLWIGEIAKHKGIGESNVLPGKKKTKVLWIYWLP